MLIIAFIKIYLIFLIRKIKNLGIYLPGKFLEIFSALIWLYYSPKIHSKEIEINGLSLDKFYILEDKYDLYIENFKLRLKTIDYYSKIYNVRLLRLIPIDIKNNLYYIVENASNYSGHN